MCGGKFSGVLRVGMRESCLAGILDIIIAAIGDDLCC